MFWGAMRLLVLINPHSGTVSKRKIAFLLEQALEQEGFDFEIISTQYAGHAQALALEKLPQKDLLMVVGGDGTVNEVLPALLQNPQITLAIFPCGSGNGIARTFDLPHHVALWIEKLKKPKIQAIDLGKIGEKYFLGFAGLGIDAEVAAAFTKTKVRGLWGYVYHSFRCFLRFKPFNLSFEIEGELKHFSNLVLASLLNTPQLGNGFYLSPSASCSDGLLDLVLVKKFPWYQIPAFLYAVFARKLNHFSYATHFSFTKMELLAPNRPLNLDGESFFLAENSSVEVLAGKIRLLI